MKRSPGFLAAAILLGVAPLQAQDINQTPSRRHFLGGSAFVVANFVLSDSPDFYQLNYGYWLTNRDVVSVEAITWKFDAPLGIPYGPSLGSADEAYPGFVREYGLGVAYQRFLWRNAYSGLHALPLLSRYFDENGGKIQNGFRLFLTLRIGYHLRLLQDRFFLEPSIAATHWPISTNVPAAFAEKDRKWPNYFLFEPGLHFGVKF
jgi:hypothetical protein